MNCFRCFPTLLVIMIVSIFAAKVQADDYTLEKIESAPKGLADKVAMELSETGYRIVGPKRPLCEIWLRKEIPVKEGFSPTLSLYYPLKSGELIGVLQVPKRADFSDFREQPIDDGVYTLRYGKQPQDGNHIGTSEYSDFLLALPAKEDESTETVEDEYKLNQQSAEAAGGAHPAIFQLLPPKEVSKGEKLVHEEDHDFWILELKKSDAIPLSMKLIVVGHGEE